MVLTTKSITEELLSLVSLFPYTEQIPCLDTDDFMPLWNVRQHELSHLFVIDRGMCLVDGEINNEHLFTTFGNFSDEDAESVRSDIIECIESCKNIYNAVDAEFFNHRQWSITEWAMAVCSQFYYGDELLLFALCRVFHRHALIVCRE